MDLDSVGLKKIQKKELEIFKYFDDVCGRNGLRYFAIGGTCIGAVRHNGFIPWDDDIDVAMPYSDYKRFIELISVQSAAMYEVLEPNTCRHMIANFVKLHDPSTTFIEKDNLKYKDRYTGVFIDVFPVFGLPDSGFRRKIVVLTSELLNKLNFHMRYSIMECASVPSKVAHIALFILKLFFRYDFFSELQNQVLRKYDFFRSKYIIFPWRGKPSGKNDYKEVFFGRDFRECDRRRFEDTSICIPHGYHRYLTMDFGDYMVIPPADKRIGFHTSALVSLKRPYKVFALKGKKNFYQIFDPKG